MPLPLQFLGMYRLGTTTDTRAISLEGKLHALAGPPLYRDERLSLFGATTDRWPGSAILIDAQSITLVLGEPLLVENATPTPRAQSLSRISLLFSESQPAVLTDTHGSYCGLHYHRKTGVLHLFTDKVGLRGLFIADLGKTVLFSSTLDPLLQLAEPYTTTDEAAVAETIAFGHPLGDRTRLQACKRLLEAQMMRCTPTGHARKQYHNWIADINHTQSLDTATDNINSAFAQAVKDRLAVCPADNTFAFLSGGMDSRLIVNALCAEGKHPVTLNVAPSVTQDALLGQLAADYFGTKHHTIPATTISLTRAIDNGVRQICVGHSKTAGRLWWSGDGGSVGLGHVYLTTTSCPEGEMPPEGIAHTLIDQNNWRISERALKREWCHLCEQPVIGVIEELKRYNHLPPEKRAYAFLLFNNQRRHLDTHFQSLETREHELILPFFYDRLLQVIFKTPIKYLLYHHLYNNLFSRHLPKTHDVAWQVYPGHEACPHPAPQEGRYQWDSWADRTSIRRAQRAAARKALSTLRGRKVAPQISRAAMSAAATQRRFRNQHHKNRPKKNNLVTFSPPRKKRPPRLPLGSPHLEDQHAVF